MTSRTKEPLILVVDASLNLLNIYHDILENEGYEVELSNYTFEGVQTIERLRPDLIILDFEREGQREEWVLLKMLKMHETTANIPIIVNVAPLYNLPEQQAYFERKNVLLLFAPIGKEDLLAAIRQLLSKK